MDSAFAKLVRPQLSELFDEFFTLHSRSTKETGYVFLLLLLLIYYYAKTEINRCKHYVWVGV